ncbi:hypothetical protein IscW_ISCW019791 [Ixodes scapularis]|uniref:UME domain-containing protein n=1 Tax=Ixodes scapularis TaxID=6945 RepID=B7PUX8_IXOSC|nr:hypothetical protein IscW_ISCW019791 [Ixodes scapularis]|eukprot:XP_002406936.1 hypothetical protein IscW_ISCW019791 [Ixodes scapularis]
MALRHAASLTALTALSQIEGTSNQAAVPHEELPLRYRHLLDNILTSLLKDSETGFSESLVGRLLALLSIPGLAPLCGQFCQVLESLLRLYKRHKVVLLRQFLDSLLELFVDVCQFCASDTGNAAVTSQFGVTLSSAPGPPVSSEVRADAEPTGMQEEAQETERAALRIAFVDGGYAFRLSLVPSLLEALSSLVGAMPEFPGVSPYVTEEILLALSKVGEECLVPGVVFCLPRILNHLPVDSQLVAKLLDFLVDPEASIRYRFSSSLQALVAAGGSNLQDQVIRRLRRALDDAWQASNTQLQDSLLITVSQLGRHPVNTELREFAVLCLLEHSLCCSPNVAEAATQEFLFESMIKSCAERRFSLGKFLSPLVGAFGFADVRALLISVLRFLLPPLVLQSDTSSSRLLRALARELKTNRRDLLMTHFRHVFAYLVCNAADSQLATALSFVEALSSLERIIKLMGQRHVTALRMKLMATLKLALRLHHGEFPAINCSIWNTFVHNLEPASLGPMLSQVTAILLPLLKLDPGGAKDIFDFLFVENRERFEEYFPDLHFISELPELEHVKDAVAPSEQSGLELKALSTGEAVVVHTGIDDENFAYDLLQRLCRSYLAAEDSRVQDCSSYAIQEVLKIYNCSDSQSKSGQSLWKRFSSDVQELFTPMLSSRY